jgi:hypothetical protein
MSRVKSQLSHAPQPAVDQTNTLYWVEYLEVSVTRPNALRNRLKSRALSDIHEIALVIQRTDDSCNLHVLRHTNLPLVLT